MIGMMKWWWKWKLLDFMIEPRQNWSLRITYLVSKKTLLSEVISFSLRRFFGTPCTYNTKIDDMPVSRADMARFQSYLQVYIFIYCCFENDEPLEHKWKTGEWLRKIRTVQEHFKKFVVLCFITCSQIKLACANIFHFPSDVIYI